VFVTAAKGIRWIEITGEEPMRVGQTLRLQGVAYDVNRKPVGNAPMTWNSDDPAIAAVDAKTGTVTAVATGTTHVHASAAGRQASVSLTVR